MEYCRLGSTGLEISRLCLGCMSFGEPERGNHPWSLGEDAAIPVIRQALEAGINFFDTANVYSDGSSEEILGRALAEYASRDEVVVATKVCARMNPGPNGAGLSRKVIMSEIDNSLRRLKMEYVDLYQIHRFDPSTPVEETLETLHDVVRVGKALYIGASSMYAWQFSKMLHASDRHGWPRFVSMQNYYNLLYREEEREMLPLCSDQGVGVIPWGPLAHGLLARGWEEKSRRSDTSRNPLLGQTDTSEKDRPVADAVTKVARERGTARAQVALAWLLSKPVVSAPIIGVTASSQLDDAIASLEVRLDLQEIESLEQGYEPHAIYGH